MGSIAITTTALGFSVKIDAKGILQGTGVSIVPYSRKFEHWKYDFAAGEDTWSGNYYQFYEHDGTCYFPKYDLDRFKEWLTSQGLAWEQTDKVPVEGKDTPYLMMDWVAYKNEAQEKAVPYLCDEKSGSMRGLGIQTGRGKATAYDTPVKTPAGWVPIGDLKIGDIVCTADGDESNVVGVYPQGIRPMLQFTFEDNRTIEYDHDHLCLVTKDISSDQNPLTWYTVTAATLLSQMVSYPDEEWFIPAIRPGEEEESAYVDHLEVGFRVGSDSSIEDIDAGYLQGSEDQKASFVQGLLDASNRERGSDDAILFNLHPTVAAKLTTFFHSLGDQAQNVEDPENEGRMAVIFTLDKPLLKIKSIVPSTDKEAVCIEIDHSSRMFIAGPYIATHNTVSFIWAVQKMGKRALITMTSRLEQWVKELMKFTNLDEDDIYVISGTPSIAKLFDQIDKDIHPKFIIASTQTMKRYLDYGPSLRHMPPPSEFCEKLNIGIVGTDEYHEHFMTNYNMGIVLNAAVFIPITATFIPNDPFVKNIFDQFVPEAVRFTGADYHKYTNITSYRYNAGNYSFRPFDYTQKGVYSQIKYENFLLSKRGSKVMENMVENAIVPIMNMHYDNIAKPGEKSLTLVATQDMCDYVAKAYTKNYPHRKVSVFYGGIPEKVLDESDMIVSTPGSAGTGRDVKKLKFCFNLVNTKAEAKNKQFLGRLRTLDDGDPEFAYMSTINIPKHVEYNQARTLLYGPLGKTFKHRSLP